MSNRILNEKEHQVKIACMVYLISAALAFGLAFIVSGGEMYYESEKNIKTNKEILKSKLDSIAKRDVQKSADTLDIDDYRLIVKKVTKNQNQR